MSVDGFVSDFAGSLLAYELDACVPVGRPVGDRMSSFSSCHTPLHVNYRHE